jgi:L-ascorbate metabolism protein UlaG (beta-lactamase superfamily)
VTRLTWLGHSTVLVEMDGVRVLTDPVLRRRVIHLVRERAVSPSDLRGVDTAVLSHLHYDHLDIGSLRSLGRELPIVVPRGGGALLRRRGFRVVTEVEPGEEVSVGAVRLLVVPAVHEGRRRPLGPEGPAVGYVIAGESSVYFPGDTDLFDGMREIEAEVALLPVAGWGPKVGPGHLDPQRAAEALALLRPRIAVPIHWGTYRVTGRASHGDAPARAFAEAAAALAPEVRVRVLPVGQALDLDAQG